MTWEDAKTYQSQLETFLAENATNATITGGVDDATIAEAEAALGVRFPDSYRWYLHRFGYCSLYGVEILGIGRGHCTPGRRYGATPARWHARQLHRSRKCR